MDIADWRNAHAAATGFTALSRAFAAANAPNRLRDRYDNACVLMHGFTEHGGCFGTSCNEGLMQQLFPAKDQTTSRLRFSNNSDWTEANLPDVTFFQEGPGIMAVDFYDKGVPLVRLSGVSGASVTLNGCNYLDPQKVTPVWPHFCLELNDLIISTSATFGLVSTVTDAAVGFVFYTGLIRFRSKVSQLHHDYLKVFLGSGHFARQVESAAVGGGIKHFGPTHLKQMKIPLPSLAEQQLIAECLTSCDSVIASSAQRIDALKDHKKGLMQQLFPSPVPATA